MAAAGIVAATISGGTKIPDDASVTRSRFRCVGCGGGEALSWVDGTRFAFPSYGFFGRLKGLFLRLDLAVAGRRAEGWSRIAVGDRAAWRGAQRP